MLLTICPWKAMWLPHGLQVLQCRHSWSRTGRLGELVQVPGWVTLSYQAFFFCFHMPFSQRRLAADLKPPTSTASTSVGLMLVFSALSMSCHFIPERSYAHLLRTSNIPSKTGRQHFPSAYVQNTEAWTLQHLSTARSPIPTFLGLTCWFRAPSSWLQVYSMIKS